jgi:hypothetical protein
VLLWVLVNALPSFYIIHATKYLNRLDEENKKRFSAFRRLDLDKFSYISAILVNVVFFPRFIMCWIVVFMFTTILLILMIGTSQDKPIGKFRENAVFYLFKPFVRAHMLLSGVIWAQWSIKPNVDYSEYLGPDWKPSYEGAGIQVSNHSGWLDIMALLYLN